MRARGGVLTEAEELLRGMGLDLQSGQQTKKQALDEKVGKRAGVLIAGKAIDVVVKQLRVAVKKAETLVNNAEQDSLSNVAELRKKFERLQQILIDKENELEVHVNDIETAESDPDVVGALRDQADVADKEHEWKEVSKCKELVDQKLRALADCWQEDGGYFLTVRDSDCKYLKEHTELLAKKNRAENDLYVAREKVNKKVFFKEKARKKFDEETSPALQALINAPDQADARARIFYTQYRKLVSEFSGAFESYVNALANRSKLDQRKNGGYGKQYEWFSTYNFVRYPFKNDGNRYFDVHGLFKYCGYSTDEIK
ncbi:MAG: hypothetical protein A3J93_00515 [Candidatus Magasanikbacteria bacterium RIFOXYC2_FULL_42_28]|uniref:Uncharacterized protein n=1 Tax=Candidatus Magasanikbacteria bacterium RIFOXYC2_FULL_42_28 TaxID=1798704 RepID=A0A1F6NWB0_9BACT|nr:MAG: hypothetical protein A3J93_00515 [Candidatus Magasanikbacteria bacterium RIFOXYC2_FULL_42_28]